MRLLSFNNRSKSQCRWLFRMAGYGLTVAILLNTKAPLAAESQSGSIAYAGQTAHNSESFTPEMYNQFTKNCGQWDPKALFRATAPGGLVWISNNAITYQIFRARENTGPIEAGLDTDPETIAPDPQLRGKRETWTIKAQFMGTQPAASIMGQGSMPTTANYFMGNDPARWRQHVKSYEAVQWTDLYPGIDLLYYSNGSILEYDFVVHPNGRLEDIGIQYEGVESVQLHPDGHLELKTPLGSVVEQAPIIYQHTASGRTPVEGHFEIKADGTVSFRPDREYDRRYDLIIDPQLSFSTYLSGTQDEFMFDVVPTADGGVLVSGALTSSDFPTITGYDSTFNGIEDHFITKLSPTTKTIQFSTYIGGGARETGGWLAVGNDNTIWLGAVTQSADYPMADAMDSIFGGGEDIVLSRLSADGDSMLYSTFIGGSDTDRVSGIVLDAKGNVYMSGLTYSSDFPTAGTPYQATSGGGAYDGVVMMLDSTGQSLVYSTYLGALSSDICRAVAVDSADNIFVTGGTRSVGFPATPGAYDITYNGTGANYDVFVAKFAPQGASLLWSTFLGGTGDDFAYDIDIDHLGRPCIVGHAHTGFPVTGMAPAGGGYEAFAARLSADGAALEFSRILAGTSDDIGRSGAIDSQNRIYVGGNSRSSDFPFTVDAYQSSNMGGYDAFVAVLDPDQDSILNSTYIGGTSGDTQRGLALTSDVNREYIYIAGYTTSANFPMTGAIDSTVNPGGFLDGFVSRLTFSWCCQGAVGNVNGIGIVDLSDLSSLVSYLTGGGFTPACQDEANVNTLGIVDLADLSALVSYLTGGGYVLPSCP